MTIHITATPEETKRVAAEFARSLHGGEIVFLEGELGAGKTTFVKGLVEALGSTDDARSPTFSVMNLYQTSGNQIAQVAHLDCYRLKRPEELLELGLEDLLNRTDTVLVVEWPPVELTPPADRIRRIKCTIVDDQTRQIEIA